MATYKLTLQYNGQKYAGWQIQPDQLTIQGKLNGVLAKIAKSQNIKSLASGRTDAGVHAMGQVVKVELPVQLTTDQLEAALNSLLPNLIRVSQIEIVTDDFHPIRDSKSKTYHYYFANVKHLTPFCVGLISKYSYGLDLLAMQQCAKLFEGKHDFNLFHVRGSDPLSTIRFVHSCRVEPLSSTSEIPAKSDNLFVIKVTGEGFLKQMVRSMVGAIWEVGRGKASVADVEQALSGKGKRIGAVAPPDGLYLWEVQY